LARHDPRARRYFLRVLRRRPLSVKAWLSLAHSLALTLR
jgi:hypothetical protein